MIKQFWCWGVIFVLGISMPLFAKTQDKKKIDAARPRLVMVEVPSWKTTFFGLPQELPLLIKSDEKFKVKSRHYDFTEGMEAMKVFLALRPKDKHAKAYRRFLQKWPLYQKFFKSVEQEVYSEAAKLLEKIVEIDPQEPAVYFYWGSLNTHLKKYSEAEKNYKACLKYYPTYGPAYINLARLAKARGANAQARGYLQEALRRLKNSRQDDARHIAQKMLESLDRQ